MSTDPDTPVTYWPALWLMAGPGAAVPFRLTPLAEAALDKPAPDSPEPEADR